MRLSDHQAHVLMHLLQEGLRLSGFFTLSDEDRLRLYNEILAQQNQEPLERGENSEK